MKNKIIEEMAKTICKTCKEQHIDVSKNCKCMPVETCSAADMHAEALYNAGYRKVPYGAVILSPEERDDEMKEINKTLAERDENKAKIDKLEEQLAEYKKPIDKFIKDREVQAVKEFAERLKNEVYPFLQAEMYNKKYCITGNIESDICREHQNQNIGILKAQDVLSKWFKVKIDELLNEYENEKCF